MSVETTGAAQGIAQSPGSRVKDCVALLRRRAMSLVVFAGFAGLVVAPDGLHPLRGAVAVLCTADGAVAAGAINMRYDCDIDARWWRGFANGQSRLEGWLPTRRSPSASRSPCSRSCSWAWQSTGPPLRCSRLASAFMSSSTPSGHAGSADRSEAVIGCHEPRLP